MNNVVKGIAREYRKLPVEGVVLVRSRKHMTQAGSWLKENVDFTDLSSFLGYKFDARTMYLMSTPKGIIRGGHLENRARILTVVSGIVFVVLVDLRDGDNKGKAVSFELGRGKEVWADTVLVPEGVIASYVSLTKKSVVVSIGNKPFNRFESMMTLNMFDPELNIEWPKITQKQSDEFENELLTLKEFINKN